MTEQEDEESSDVGAGCRGNNDDEVIESLYDLDKYDEEKGVCEREIAFLTTHPSLVTSTMHTGESVCGAGMGNSLSGLTYFASNDQDPYITLKTTVSNLIVR